jgi:hypothetical protein
MITCLFLKGKPSTDFNGGLNSGIFIIIETAIYSFDVNLIVPRLTGMYPHHLSWGNLIGARHRVPKPRRPPYF